jgi:hypothetical protein
MRHAGLEGRTAGDRAGAADAPIAVERRLQRSLTTLAMLRGADALTPGLVEAVAREATIAVAEEQDGDAIALLRRWHSTTSSAGQDLADTSDPARPTGATMCRQQVAVGGGQPWSSCFAMRRRYMCCGDGCDEHPLAKRSAGVSEAGVGK